MHSALSRIIASLSYSLLAVMISVFGVVASVEAQVPPIPSSLNPSEGTQLPPAYNVVLSWSPTPDAWYYNVRANNWTNGALRDPQNNCVNSPHYMCVNGLSSNSISMPVDPGSTYQFFLHACNANGCGDVAYASFTVMGFISSAPTGVSPDGATFPYGTSNVTLSWAPTANATFYAIRANDLTDSGPRVPGNTCPGNPHYLCTDVGSNSIVLPVTSGHTYSWWVHACNPGGCGAQASAMFAVASAPAAPPPPPTNLQHQCSQDGTSVTMTWSPVANATGYASRMDYQPNNGPGCTDGWICSGLDQYGSHSGNSYTANIVAGSPYVFWTHTIAGGIAGDAAYHAFTCGETFPPFTRVRSDFINLNEGSAAAPMAIASPPCVNLPYVSWQDWMCSTPPGFTMPATYAATNSFSTTPDPYYAWIISSNNEFLPNTACDSGPPNQSRPINSGDSPFHLAISGTGLKIEVRHDEPQGCRKIPYMSATYIRGVQAGDPKQRIFTWNEMFGRTLVLDVDIQKQPGSLVTWFKVLTHFRDPVNGQRYFINTNFVLAPELGDDSEVLINWNWPFVHSFQYPGAKILIPARTAAQNLPNGFNRIYISLASQWLERPLRPAGVFPEFLGVEVAVEIAEIGSGISAEIKDIKFQ